MDKDRSEERNSGKGYKTTEGNGTKIKKQNITKKLFVCLLTSMLCFTYLSILDAGASRGDEENSIEFYDEFLKFRVLNDHEVEVIDSSINDFSMPSITIPETVLFAKTSIVYDVVSIGEEAFLGKKFTVITAPSVKHVGQRAFSESTIADLILPKLMYADRDAFRNCGYLIHADFPELVSIGKGAFQECGQLVKFDAPELVSIGDSAFKGCMSLTDVNIPKVTDIGKGVFSNCSKLENINVGNDNKNYSVKENGAALFTKDEKVLLAYPSASGEYTVPETVTAIGEYAFSSSMLEKIVLPNVTTIGSNAFESCFGLSTVDATLLEYIGDNAFRMCYNMGPIDLTKVVYIGDNASLPKENITVLDLPSVIYIGDYAFGGSMVLNTVNAPLAKHIGYYAFSSCPQLTTVNIPLAEYIGPLAFNSCVLIKELYLPNVKVVGGEAFVGCRNLKVLNLSSVEIIGSEFHQNTVNLELLVISDDYVYTGTVDPFKAKKTIFVDGNVIVSAESNEGELTVKVSPKKGSTIENAELRHGENVIPSTEGFTWVFDGTVSNEYTIKADTADILVDVTISSSRGKGSFKYRFVGEGDFVDVPEGGVIRVKIGSTFEVKAVPEKGYVFKGWNDGSGRSTLVLISVDDNMSVSAKFKKVHSIKVSTENNGHIDYRKSGESRTRLPDDGSLTVEEDESVEIIAVAEDGYEFVGWVGSGTNPSLTISSLDEDIELTAIFKRTSSSTGTGDDMFFTISTAALLLLAVLGIVLIYIRRQ